MIKRGSKWLAEGTVVAISPTGSGEVVVTVETFRPINTRMSGAAEGYEAVQQAQPLVAERVVFSAEAWARFAEDMGGSDMVLARKVVIEDLKGAAQ